ncbi:hypothetical protein CWO91_21350 [Bradyrhizobium genosp. SA-3]|uniref:hypothetical protein n=1 Tax=Bradyrhizobium genosp. SA-3 TaxID=508868 RepID=UPI001028A4EA|nr:hypothetical protein [Bradyrhizobium genosp. SA-3]RZN08704.1 hypothetical protein CWO91_21350 [Bradyrhizobium genosp. SA-3]
MQGPDGAIVEFPAGTSHEEMTTALRKHYGVPAQPPLPPLPPGYKLDPPAAVPRLPTAFKLDVPVAAPELPQAAAAPAQPKLVPVDHDPFAPPVAPATPGLGAQNAAREGRLYVTPEAPKPIERPV